MSSGAWLGSKEDPCRDCPRRLRAAGGTMAHNASSTGGAAPITGNESKGGDGGGGGSGGGSLARIPIRGA